MGIADKIISKVEESMEKVDEGNYEYLPKRPQPIIDEETIDLVRELTKKQTEEEMYMPDSEEEFQSDLEADEMRYHHYCLEQQEMYDDPVMNWSGLR